MNIAVLGSGYVGLVTAAVFAELGHTVVGVDIDATRVARLSHGESPIYEPGLDKVLARNLANGRIRFTTDTADAVQACPVIFLAVGTPPAADGSTDLAQVESAVRGVAAAATEPRTVVMKSTVPVGTGHRVAQLLAEYAPDIRFDVLSNPEFLREGTALQDAFHPDRIVIGAPSPEAAAPLLALYDGLDCPVLLTDVPSAEMIKYASNAFLATKISFINCLSDLCERAGADVRKVAEGMGADPRISPHFLNAGIGYGGSCLPKDVDSLIAVSQAFGACNGLLEAVRDINHSRVPHLCDNLAAALGGLAGKIIAVLGLTFKPDTDDLRESRALDLCRALVQAGATVRAHDPMALTAAAPLLPGVCPCPDLQIAIDDADAVIVATEWAEYLQLDLAALRRAMHGNLLVDARNAFSPAAVTAAGLRYLGIGGAHLARPLADLSVHE